MNKQEVEKLLREKTSLYNHSDFIATDPIQIPHRFEKKEDIEISGFLTAVIAWGQRVTIINNATRLMQMMDNSPHDFIVNHQDKDLIPFENFVHRTFNGDDCLTFIAALKRFYLDLGGLESVMARSFKNDQASPGSGWTRFKSTFFEVPHLKRSEKHLPDPAKGSAAKRMNMYLRWMIRKDDAGVDFGIWDQMNPSQLYLPLDVHTGRVARKLKLLKRKQDDWKAVLELNEKLKQFDSEDPVRFDFGLFGLGAFEKF
ncbi:TIGR02757 family protein [Cryomorphaceae bacterium 1068]|nr:TIGR02757 family protein [Cryomorphaceae bacterium 1068]